MEKAFRGLIFWLSVFAFGQNGLQAGEATSAKANTAITLRNAPTSVVEGILQALTGRYFQSALSLVQAENHRFYLSGSDQTLVSTALRDLILWSGQKVVIPRELKFDQQIDVTVLIQRRLSNLPIQEGFVMNGANCHNTSLVTAGLLKSVSYTNLEEMEFYLRTYCGKINGQPRMGDIGYRGGLFSHSLTVVSENMTFEKKNNLARDSYHFVIHARLPTDMQYFRCGPVLDVTVGCGEPQDGIVKSVGKADAFYSRLLHKFEDPETVATAYRQTQALYSALSKLKGRDFTCEQIRMKFLVRLGALEELGQVLDGNGVGQVLQQSHNPLQGRY